MFGGLFGASNDLSGVLVTGASGFIGQYLCAALRKNGIYVRTLGRKKSDAAEDFYLWDFAHPLHIEALDGIDTVFHLAGKAHVSNADYHDEAEYFPVNIAATRKLLEASSQAGVQRFVYFSSVKAAGYRVSDGKAVFADELCDILPESMYGRSKSMAEQLVLGGGFVPDPVVIRPSMVYGNTTKGNLPKMIRAIQNRRFPPLPDTGNQRSMVHVDDIVRAALLAATHPDAPGNTYIVTDNQTYSTRQMYEWICEALHRPLPRWDVPLSVLAIMGRAGDVVGRLSGRSFIFDSGKLSRLVESEIYSSAKIERELNFQPQRNLHESLPEITQYVCK